MAQKIIHRWLGYALILIMPVALAACGMSEGDVTCTPPPQITSYPPTDATVGQLYFYDTDASYLCGMWNICNGIVGIQLPQGAVIEDLYDSISWTPSVSQANTDVQFVIATKTDDCGDWATQSWTVHVSP